MHTLKILSVALGLAFAVAHANAALIVDTGAPDGNGFPLAVDDNDWYAGKFNVAAGQTTITAINWYLDMDTDLSQSTSFTISLYGNSNSSKPDVSNLLYSGTATFGSTGWNGLSALNWNVNAGTYWAALESSSGFVGLAPVTASALTASGLNTAFNDGSGYHLQNTGLGFGLQVDAVPEPETYALMLAGLGLIGVAARRKSQAA